MILSLGLANADITFDETKWQKLSPEEQLEMAKSLFEIAQQLEQQRDEYKKLLEFQTAEVDRLLKQAKKKVGGFSFGVKGGFSYTNPEFEGVFGFTSRGYVLFFERVFISPGLTIGIINNPGLDFSFSVGLLF